MHSSRGTASFGARLDGLARPGVRQALGVVTFTIHTALSAKIQMVIPGTEVPFTFQPLAVMLAGGLLGARLGAASQILYLMAGAAGIPVFAFGTMFVPTAGYLLAYPVAAFAVGALSGRSTLRNLIALLSGLALIYAGGVAWLATSAGWGYAITAGLLPFVLPDLAKVLLALTVMHQLRDESRAVFGVER
jgi:biotin transport system substrate-specific component